ncbi:NAD(+) diphosphatase [Thalassovita aquimarina]|uniref:NAD(+) diphosphatase n=1 Tax=Thalassovita aquimarina TaxID=2785917 RepID=UPI00356458E5
MKNAETVTFGGSALDRAAEIRGDAAVLAAAMAAPEAVSIVLWRGKPLISRDAARRPALTRVPMDHPVLQETRVGTIFLGREDSGPVFAHDISAWTPEVFDDTALNSFLDRSEQHHPSLNASDTFAELRAVMAQLSPRDAELAATARALFGWHRSHRFCSQCGQESGMAMAGWQRDCPACGGHHFPRTDPVVIMLITRGNSVLMGRSHGWPEGMYSLLAGFVEPGETIEAAVRRETWEEAGIRVGAVDYLASQPWPFPASLMIGCKGVALSEAVTIDPKEIDDARWFTREEIMLSFSGGHPELKPARQGAIAHFLLRNWLADRVD